VFEAARGMGIDVDNHGKGTIDEILALNARKLHSTYVITDYQKNVSAL
jgi:hypothetical protein